MKGLMLKTVGHAGQASGSARFHKGHYYQVDQATNQPDYLEKQLVFVSKSDGNSILLSLADGEIEVFGWLASDVVAAKNEGWRIDLEAAKQLMFGEPLKEGERPEDDHHDEHRKGRGRKHHCHPMCNIHRKMKSSYSVFESLEPHGNSGDAYNHVLSMASKSLFHRRALFVGLGIRLYRAR